MNTMLRKETIRSTIVPFTLFVIVTVSAMLMLFAARTDSGTSDELPHITAGYGYVHELDSRLNSEHPPLLKALSALPLLLLDPTFPTKSVDWETGMDGQWRMGKIFLYGSGNDPEQLIFLARLTPIFFTLLLVILIFIVAKDLFGPRWALFPTALFAFSPTILAHGHYVTTDIAGAFGILLAIILFLAALRTPSRKNLILAGLAFGLAQVLKFSAVILIPYFVILTCMWMLLVHRPQSAGFRQTFLVVWKGIGRTVLIGIIGYGCVVYPLYFLFTRNYPIAKQTADTEILLRNVAGGPTHQGALCVPMRCVAEITIAASGHELTRPFAQYALGIQMVMDRMKIGNTKYFFGEISNAKIMTYFPVVFALKESLPALLFLLLGILVAIRAFFRRMHEQGLSATQKLARAIREHFTLHALLLFVVIYAVMSFRSPLQIGVRHLIPVIPLLYILLTSTLQKWSTEGNAVRLKKAVIVFLLGWVMIETTMTAPYFLSYTNQLGGGVSGGYRYVTDSNYDWGQDFLRFNEWAKENLHGEKIAIDYFGAAAPAYYLPDQAVLWNSEMGDPRDSGISWFAISINSLESALATPDPSYPQRLEETYAWLTAFRPKTQELGGVPKPDHRAGTTIFIYKLDEQRD